MRPCSAQDARHHDAAVAARPGGKASGCRNTARSWTVTTVGTRCCEAARDRSGSAGHRRRALAPETRVPPDVARQPCRPARGRKRPAPRRRSRRDAQCAPGTPRSLSASASAVTSIATSSRAPNAARWARPFSSHVNRQRVREPRRDERVAPLGAREDRIGECVGVSGSARTAGIAACFVERRVRGGDDGHAAGHRLQTGIRSPRRARG